MSTATVRTPVPRLPRLAAAWSAICVALATWWLLDPTRSPLPAEGDDAVSLLGSLDARAGAWLCLAVGLAGAATAAALAGIPRERGAARTAALVASGLIALFILVVAPDIQLLSVLGYLMALFGLPVVVVLLVVGARRHRANMVALGVIATAVAVGAVTGQIGRPTLELYEQMSAGMATVGPRPLVIAFLAAGGLLFTAATMSAARAGRRDADGSEARRLQQVGRVATIVAALGPVPYGLIRMTWATPWPQGLGPGHEEMLNHGIRVFGICLGLSALTGCWLTLGLISRWGEMWPGWLPGLRGRPVPVMAAVVPAGLVAAALCAGAVSLVVMALREDELWLLFAIPAPVWGPALAVATYAYYRRRTDAQPGSRHPDPAPPVADRHEAVR